MRNLQNPFSLNEESLSSSACHIGQTSVGTSAVPLDSMGWTAAKSVVIKALAANTGKVYVGIGDAVTSGNGFELSAGDEIELKVFDIDSIYLIASAASQAVCWRSL